MRLVQLIEGDVKTRHAAVSSCLLEFFGGNPASSINPYRVAYELPSGRPTITCGAKDCAVSVSLSHIDLLTAMVLDDELTVGIDLVRLSDAAGLRDWTVGDLTSNLRSSDAAAYCWAAREAAYKALAFDRPFQPDNFGISFSDRGSFKWTFKDHDRQISGQGCYELFDGIVCAVAIGNPIRREADR